MLSRTIAIIDRIADWTGTLIAPLTLVMTLVTVGVVVARYGFGIGAIPMQEAVMYMHAIVFMLGIGYTLKMEGHVRVDIVYQKLSRRGQAIVDLLGTLCFLFPVAAFTFWTSLDYVALSWRMGEGSAEPGGLPGIYLLKTLIPAMAALLAIQGLAEMLRAGQRIVDGRAT